MFITAPTDNITSSKDWPRHPAELLDQYTTAPAANVGDVFDRLLVLDSGIRCLTSQTRLVGTALPILTRAGDNLAIHYALDDAQPGDVLVINGQGDLSRALIGDLIGEIMVAKGVLGAIVDGVIRDADTLSKQGLSVFARGTTPAGPFKKGSGNASSHPLPADRGRFLRRKDKRTVADTRRLPGPQLTHWDWQLAAACRGMTSTTFFHPPDERGPARENRIHDAKQVCQACPVLEQCLDHALKSQ